MINAVGAVGLIVWALIAASQLRLRAQLEAQGTLIVRMWGFPYLSWVTIAGIGAILALMAYEATTRSQVHVHGGTHRGTVGDRDHTPTTPRQCLISTRSTA